MENQTTKCCKCRLNFRNSLIRKCPHKKVNEYYGNYICGYCCEKCSHLQKNGVSKSCKLILEQKEYKLKQEKKEKEVLKKLKKQAHLLENQILF